MTILGNIRRKAGHIFIVAAIGCLMMLVVDGTRAMFKYFFDSDQLHKIGSVAGMKIAAEEYNDYYKKSLYYFECSGKKLTEKEQVYCKHDAWTKLVAAKLYDKEIKKVGITISNNELVDLVQGEHIDSDLKRCFKDPKTGVFDKEKLLEHLSDKQNSEWWRQVENILRLERAKKKLYQLMFRSKFVTDLEKAHKAKHAKMLCDVDYLYIPFATVSNDLIALTDQQLEDYMVAHRDHYKKATESRTIEYVAFPIQPDEKDNANFQKELTTLTAQFSTATDPYYFAKQHTDDSLVQLECAGDQLPEPLAKIKHTLQAGMVVGPIAQEGCYRLYKVVAIPINPSALYRVAVIEKKVAISSRTRNKCYRAVQHFAGKVKNLADFKSLANREGVVVQQESEIAPADRSIGAHAAAREVVRWLYTKAKVGKVSPIFDLGDVHLLVVMTEKLEAGGIPSLHSDMVYHRVYNKVLNAKKAQLISDKLNQIQAATLSDIAEQYGNQIEVKSVTGLNFLKNDDNQLRQAKVFVGKCFSFELNTISKPIIDQEGVFMACVRDRYSQEIVPSDEKDDQIEQLMQDYYIRSSMEEQAKITDRRYEME